MTSSPTIRLRNPEQTIRYFTGGILVIISALMTLSLFLTLAGEDRFRQVVLGVTAGALEFSKVLTYRLGRRNKIIAFSLITLSCLATFGSALLIVENNEAYARQTETEVSRAAFILTAAENEVLTLDTEIAALVMRMEDLPPIYVTATKDLGDRIESLRNRRTEVLSTIALPTAGNHELKVSATSMFTLFAKMFSVDEDWIIVVLLMFLAILVEASILSLTKDYSTLKAKSSEVFHPKSVSNVPVEDSSPSTDATAEDTDHKKAHRAVFGAMGVKNIDTIDSDASRAFHEPMEDKEISSDEFLFELARGKTYPFLNGRNVTAARIGLQPYRAQVLTKQLLSEGKIKVEGKRLIRTDIFHGSTQNADQQEQVVS